MGGEFITKRPHKKSRGGCKTCKTKKIKCDETQPKCGFCLKRNLTCEYLPRSTRQQVLPYRSTSSSPEDSSSTPSSSSDDEVVEVIRITAPNLLQNPSPALMTAGRTLSKYDMRMLHFWSLFTSQTITPADHCTEVFQLIIPQLAFEQTYLLDAILGITSLHLQNLIPTPGFERDQTIIYRSNAFAGFREALSKLDPSNSSEWQAALSTSIMLTLLCAKDYEVEEGDLIAYRWATLYRGLSTVIQLGNFQTVMDSRIKPLFVRSFSDLKGDPVVPHYLFEMIEFIDPSDSEFPHVIGLKKILNLLGVLYATLQEEGVSITFGMRTISWPSTFGPEVAESLRFKGPRLTILMAHYMMFVKCLKDVWWADGTADGDIRRVFRMLPPKWFPLLEIPRRALALQTQENLVSLILSSVDPSSTSVVKTSVREYPHAVKWYAPSTADDHNIIVEADCDC